MSKRCSLIVLLTTILVLSGCGKPSQEAVNILPAFAKQDGKRLLITHGNLQLEILPAYAGRISSLKCDNHEILLVLPDMNRRVKDWGTVLWSSPQEEWGWPPIDVLDNKPYTLTTTVDQVVLTSEPDKKTGYQFSKSYGLHGDNAFAITYRIYNRSKVEKKVAALEVTRLPPAGDVFFPHGELEPTSGIFYLLDVKRIDELTWYHYNPKKIHTDHHKIMLDGKEGWVAYTNKGYLFVKQFADLPPSEIAEGEREVEVFGHMDHTFIEMKTQGKIETLQPGEHVEWTIIWHAKKLPADLATSLEPHAMANYARDILDH